MCRPPGLLPATYSPHAEPRTPGPDDKFFALNRVENRLMQFEPESVGTARWLVAGDVSILSRGRDLDGDPGNLRIAVWMRVGMDGTAAISLKI